MTKYYTRPCNFYYGNYAKRLIKEKKALPLAGNKNIAFDQLEIFKRKLLYRASYRGTKEMDKILGAFVLQYINDFKEIQLLNLLLYPYS